jgi:hypothetical protein
MRLNRIKLCKDKVMRKWFVPITVIGLGGLGALLSTEKGREALARFRHLLLDAPDRLSGLGDAIQDELEGVQRSVDALADRLGVNRNQIAG